MLFMQNGVYEKVFNKTSLSLLDLRFKNLIFQDRAFRPSREEWLKDLQRDDSRRFGNS